jgi:hypothetical protein
MSQLPEPRRLLSRSPKDSALGLALATARAREPRAGELESLAQSLRGVLGGEPGAQVPPRAPVVVAPRVTALSSAAKWGVVVGALGLALVGVAWSLRPAFTAAPPAPTPSVAQKSEDPPPVRDEAPAPTPRATPAAASATCATGPCMRAAPQPAPAAPPRVHKPASRAEAAAPSAGSAVNELQLIDEARQSLRSSPARALALADEHAQRFPRGSMAEEREVIRISALMNLGQTSRARALAQDFLRTNPGSAYARRVEAAVATPATNR